MPAPTLEELRAVGLASGLVAVGVTDASPLTEARVAIEGRRSEGLHGGMQFTYRNPARSTEPERILAGARSLVVGAHPYAGGPVDHHGDLEGSLWRGRVARYATGDHYGALRAALSEMAVVLERAGWQARVVADDNALVDRAAAHRAGVGWFGRNANILVPGHGSWVVLGAVVTDAHLGISEAVPDGCGPCRRCLDGCPTGAIVAPGVVDARRCLAWLVQADGPFPEEHRIALGDRIYGCDDCQEVCPPSRRSPEGRADVASSGAWVDLLEMLESSDDHLLATHGRWYIPRRDPRYLRRNALIALGNVAEPGHAEVTALLERYATGGDGLLAEHARWAQQRVQERASA